MEHAQVWVHNGMLMVMEPMETLFAAKEYMSIVIEAMEKNGLSDLGLSIGIDPYCFL